MSLTMGPVILATCFSLPAIAHAQKNGDQAAPAPDRHGWVDLLANAGPQLNGCTRIPIPPTGKLSEKSPWTYDPKTQVLTCAGDQSGHEWLRFDAEHGDGTLHAEWRFIPAEGKKGYNSGIYALNSPDGKTWHQAQTGDASGGFLFGESPVAGTLKSSNHPAEPAAKSNPAGEWNVYEITCKNKTMILTVNEHEACRWSGLEVTRGHLGLEAEGYQIEFREVKWKAIDP